MIETPRLLLRRFAQSDLDALTEIRSDPEVARYIGSGNPQSREQVADVLRAVDSTWVRLGFGRYAVVLATEGILIGWCGLSLLDYTQEVELGYGIAREHSGLGYATEAARAVLDHSFDLLALQRIVAVADPGNSGSQRVLQKLGMEREGEAEYYGRTVVYYSISRIDWLVGRAQQTLGPGM